MGSATLKTSTYLRMKELANNDSQIAQRLTLLHHRVVEEFYDIEKDPNCLVNLIDNPVYQNDIDDSRSAMEAWMRESNDHALEAFLNRSDVKALARYMDKQDLERQKKRQWVRTLREAMGKKKSESKQVPKSNGE